MDIRQLRSFLKIVDTGSINRAADSLGITQPSLSQQMLRLEDEVGLLLLQRTSRGVTLTEAGRIFQDHARQMVRLSEQAIQDARQHTNEASGDVILALPPSISDLAGVALVEAFRTYAPLISLRLVEGMTGSIRGWLESGKIDVGVLHDAGTLRHLAVRRFASEELYLIGPAGKFGTLDNPATTTVRELSGAPMILPGKPHSLRQIVEQGFHRLGGDLAITHEIDTLRIIAQLIAKGYGYSILPLPIVRQEITNGEISIARIGDGSFQRHLCLARNVKHVVTQASTRCEDLTVKVLLELIDTGVWQAQHENH